MNIKSIPNPWKITIVAIVLLASISIAFSYYYNNVYYTTFNHIAALTFTTNEANADGTPRHFLYKYPEIVRYRKGVLEIFKYSNTTSPDVVVNGIASYQINPALDSFLENCPQHQIIDVAKIQTGNDQREALKACEYLYKMENDSVRAGYCKYLSERPSEIDFNGGGIDLSTLFPPARKIESMYNDSIHKLEKAFGSTSPEVATLLDHMYRFYARMGEVDLANTCAERALRMRGGR